MTGVLVLQPAWKPFGPHEGLVGLAANIVAFIVVFLATAPPDEQHVSGWLATSREG